MRRSDGAGEFPDLLPADEIGRRRKDASGKVGVQRHQRSVAARGEDRCRVRDLHAEFEVIVWGPSRDHVLHPLAATFHRSTTASPETVINSSARFTALHTWLGITRTLSPSRGRVDASGHCTVAWCSDSAVMRASGSPRMRPYPVAHAARSAPSTLEPASSTTTSSRAETTVARAVSAISDSLTAPSSSCCASPKTYTPGRSSVATV